MRLVGYLSTAQQPDGDATLLLRDQAHTDGTKIDDWSLFADNGTYYYAKTRGGRPAQVTGNHTQADEAGRKQAVAAAQYAATGDLNEGRKRMALAYVPDNPKVQPTLEAPGAVPSVPAGKPQAAAGNLTDSWVWNNSIWALTTGGGSPAVRAGVLRLLGQIPEITVSQATIDGQSVFNLAAGDLATAAAPKR